MYCKKCGSILDFSDSICSNCGEPVERAEGKVVGPRMREDVKILQSTKKQKSKEKFKWDLEGFPSETTKKTEDVVFSWGNKGSENIKDDKSSPNKGDLTFSATKENGKVSGMKLFSDTYASPFQTSAADINKDSDIENSKFDLQEKNNRPLDESVAGMSLYAKDIASPLKSHKNQNMSDSEKEAVEGNNKQLKALQEKKIAGMGMFAKSVASPITTAANDSAELTATDRGKKVPAQGDQQAGHAVQDGTLKWTDTRPYKPVRKAEVKDKTNVMSKNDQTNSKLQENAAQTTIPADTAYPGDHPKDVAITKKPIDFPFDEEVKDPVLEEKKEKSGSGKVLLVILIILLLLGGGAFAISKYMPESPAGQWINGIFDIENNNSEGQDLVDKETVVSSQLFNNQNIGEVVADETLLFDENKMYLLDGLNDSKPMLKSDLEIYEQLVGVVIKYSSAWVDYLNDGDEQVLSFVKTGSPMESHVLNYEKKGEVQIDFKKLKIGEVRQGDQGYYVWVREHISLNDGITEDESEIEKIYYLEGENNSFLISNFQ